MRNALAAGATARREFIVHTRAADHLDTVTRTCTVEEEIVPVGAEMVRVLGAGVATAAEEDVDHKVRFQVMLVVGILIICRLH